jgi:subtilisin family serine protease
MKAEIAGVTRTAKVSAFSTLQELPSSIHSPWICTTPIGPALLNASSVRYKEKWTSCSSRLMRRHRPKAVTPMSHPTTAQVTVSHHDGSCSELRPVAKEKRINVTIADTGMAPRVFYWYTSPPHQVRIKTMKRAFAALLFLFSFSAFAGQTQRYIIGMKAGSAAKTAQFAGREVEELRYLDSLVVALTDSEVAAMRNDPSVQFVERADILFFATDQARPGRSIVAESHPADAQVTPYGITLVHAPAVWPVARGAGINVAIVDTGIDYTHPEFKDRYKGGFNAITGTNDPRDDDGHGTHVAGTIGAADDNIGVVGVAPSVNLWSAKVLSPDASTGLATGSNSQIATGLNWVLSKKTELGGNWIVNMSLGQCTDLAVSDQCSTVPSFAMQSACQKLADAGVLVFAASGNDSTDKHIATVSYPAAFSSVIAVGALDASQKIAVFSNQGPEIALTGPGVDVFSTYIVGQGTNSFVTTSNASYDAFALVGAGKGTPSGQYVYCGIGAAAGDFPASVKDNIALIQRGSATFNLKTKNAIAAGAKAVVIYNCSIAATPATCGSETFGGWTLIGKVNATTGLKDPACDNGTSTNCKDDPADLAFQWPVDIGISNADGEALRKGAAGSLLTAKNVADDYVSLSGTSMACPHAAGVAALVWSVAPSASASAVKSALFNSAADLGTAGKDTTFGYGLLDAYAAARLLNPGAFLVHGRMAGRRGH